MISPHSPILRPPLLHLTPSSPTFCTILSPILHSSISPILHHFLPHLTPSSPTFYTILSPISYHSLSHFTPSSPTFYTLLSPISHHSLPQVVRNDPAPPAPVSACKMREIAHTTGLLFRLQDSSWVCSWCARHHSNLFLYDSENSPLPYNSVKLSGADITTDLQHNIYKFLITPVNQDNVSDGTVSLLVVIAMSMLTLIGVTATL